MAGGEGDASPTSPLDPPLVVLSLNACKGNFTFCDFIDPTS